MRTSLLLAAAIVAGGVSAPLAHATPLTPIHTQGEVDCTAREAYDNGVNVRNRCGRPISVKVIWSNPTWVTDCWNIDAYNTRPFPKPKPGSRYQTVLDC
ncbi:hypothetical protein GCM10023321_39210 [Pseudonocardia eucalypti]|uniref:Secreted protein n=1 Tax=Pseudonocardia eucalypti TaxID=648755 RepID=A0ABP9QC24_9PSEU